MLTLTTWLRYNCRRQPVYSWLHLKYHSEMVTEFAGNGGQLWPKFSRTLHIYMFIHHNMIESNIIRAKKNSKNQHKNERKQKTKKNHCRDVGQRCNCCHFSPLCVLSHWISVPCQQRSSKLVPIKSPYAISYEWPIVTYVVLPTVNEILRHKGRNCAFFTVFTHPIIVESYITIRYDTILCTQRAVRVADVPLWPKE